MSREKMLLRRKELERLLPVHARRQGLGEPGVIRRQEDYEAPEQLPFKACARASPCHAL